MEGLFTLCVRYTLSDYLVSRAIVEMHRYWPPWQYLHVCTRFLLSNFLLVFLGMWDTLIEKLLQIALSVIRVLYRLVVKPSVEELISVFSRDFVFFPGFRPNPVFGVFDSWMVSLYVILAIDSFWLIGPTEDRYEEYHQKPKLLFVLMVSVDLGFG